MYYTIVHRLFLPVIEKCVFSLLKRQCEVNLKAMQQEQDNAV